MDNKLGNQWFSFGKETLMLTVLLVLASILAIIVICCIAMLVCCITNGYPAFGCVFACYIIISVSMLYKITNYESRYEWVLLHKPTCTEETVECLTEQIEWVNDSITTASKLKPERVRVINIVNSNDFAHILLLKNNLNDLRNHNKEEN